MSAASNVLGERYRLDSLIGRGGMGQVWAATDLRLEREVAVKLLRDDLPAVSDTDGGGAAGTVSADLADQRARFTRECRITARLDHPGLVTVFDAGTDAGRHYLVMQRLDGLTLSDLIAENDVLPFAWAASVAAQLCAALAVVHAVPVVHRDLKPSNVMIRPDGRVVLLDLGIASAFEPELSTLTRTGRPVGTPSYMAPEQALTGRAEPRSDLYALGCTLFAMLTGDAPFHGPTPLAVMTQHVSHPPRPVRELRRDVPRALADLVAALLAKQPGDRPRSAQEVYRLLLPLLPHSVADAEGALRATPQPDPSRPFRHPSAPTHPEPPTPAGSLPAQTPAPAGFLPAQAPAPGAPAGFLSAQAPASAAGGFRSAQAPASGAPAPASAAAAFLPAPAPAPAAGGFLAAPDQAPAAVPTPALARTPAPTTPAPAGPAPAEAARQASGLYEAGRYREAAALLASALPRATAEHGASAPQVSDLRRMHARVLVEDRQYLRAHQEYLQLAHAHAAVRGPDDPEALDSASRAADCLARAGSPAAALAGYREALLGYQRRCAQGLPVDPDRMSAVRRRVGELLLELGDPAGAQSVLLPLWHELERRYGPHHPRVAELRGLLAQVSAAGPPQPGFGPPPPTW